SDRIAGLACASGWRGAFDAVASNGDVVRSYELLGSHPRGAEATRLRKKRFSPSLFVVHFGLRGEWPDVPHHTILFGPRYGELLSDIYDRGHLADDPSLYIHHPTATDPGMAPPGHSTFYALAPVPHLGKLPVDWSVEGPAYAEHILSLVEERLVPGLRDK